MQATTKTQSNILKAQRLIEVRAQLKLLTIEDKALKAHFSNLIGADTGCLIVGTAITIAKTMVQRSSYDAKHLDFYFDNKSIDKAQFKKFSSYARIQPITKEAV